MLLITLTDADEVIAGGVQTQDGAGQQLLGLGGIALVHGTALSLADALDDDLLGGLGGDAAELGDVHGNGDGVAQLDVGVVAAGGVDVDLQSDIGQLLHNGLDLVHAQTFLTDAHDNVLSGDVAMILAVLAVGVGQSLLQAVDHVLHGNALELLQLAQAFKDLLAHIDFRGSLGLLGSGGSCH